MEDVLKKFDVVITNYDALNNISFRKFHWHRIVLDECQEIKSSTTQVARLCSNLTSSYRWMVSGTPLINKIDDLNGELQFLKVWPFCLLDSEDGFWHKKIGEPFAKKRKDDTALQLIYSLIDVVMMRHSKSQRYEDGRKLVEMPPRTIEWRGFDLESKSELYVIKYLENMAAESFIKFMMNAEDDDAVMDRTAVLRLINAPNYSQIKSLLALISKTITGVGSVSLHVIDHLRRLLISDINPIMILNNHGDNDNAIPLMIPEHALAILQSGGMGTAGGFNRDTNRALSSTLYGKIEMEAREKFNDMAIKDLRWILIA
jgi:SNF2 family DNA or RNA helicase